MSSLALLLATLTLAPLAGRPGDEPTSPVPATAPSAARVEDWLRRMEAFGAHGALLVARDGEVWIRTGLGVADRATGRRITPDTVFNLGSLSKSFTAAAVLRLQDLGRLSVDDRLGDLLDAPEDKRDITLRELLSHTAGLPYQTPPEGALLAPLSGMRGEFAYSNPGYHLLADVVEAAAAEPFAAFVQRELFDRAGLTRTCMLGTRPWPFDDGARAYTDDTDQGDVADWPADPGPGGVASTVDDLLRFDRAIRGGAVLSDASREAFLSPLAAMGRPGMDYGFGWMFATTLERGTRVRFHQGNHGGFNADCRSYEDEGVFLAFLSNHFVRGRSMRDAIVNDVSRMVAGGDPSIEPPAVVAGDPTAAARVAGEYETASGGALRVEADGDALMVRGLDEAGAAALFAPGDPDLAAEAADRTALTATLARAIAEGDPDAVRDHLSPALPFAPTRAHLDDRGRALREAHGPLAEVQPILTAADGPGAGRSIATLVFEDGAEVRFGFTWDRGRVLHIAEAAELPGRRFLPGGPGVYRAFDIFRGTELSLTWDADRAAALGDATLTRRG